MPQLTFFWHDYETFGVDPRLDRPCQFAGVRTDEDLHVIDEPLALYCKPAPDRLPSPEACLITGITPQLANERGLIEAEFVHRIHQELAAANTCGVGYNSLRFDDEVTRHLLYRNFHDPYAREWQNNCSRWDIIDLARMCYALRPQGTNWPTDDTGKPSFKLENLTAANNIEHADAHDATSDVFATISLARHIKSAQPQLFRWLFDLRIKHQVLKQIDLSTHRPLVHTTRMYPAAYGCTSLVCPIGFETNNKSSLLVYDLRVDPMEFLQMDEEMLGNRVFNPATSLTEGENRLPIKSLKVNKCPAIAPVSVLTEDICQRIDLDLDSCARHRETIIANPAFRGRIMRVFENRIFTKSEDIDASLYDGFFGNADKKLIEKVSHSSPNELATGYFPFEDSRLVTLLWRYRARNWPDSLSEEEIEQWRENCMENYHHPESGIESYFEKIAQLKQEFGSDQTKQSILDDLVHWGDALLAL